MVDCDTLGCLDCTTRNPDMHSCPLSTLQEFEAGGSNLDRTRWSQEEDVLLCEAWKFVSQCPIAGKDRKRTDLWSDVLKHFRENGGTRLSKDSLTSRWKILKVEFHVWKCSLREANLWKKSGSNLQDEMEKAQEFYKKAMKKKQTNKAVIKEFSNFDAFMVVDGFEQFQDIPSIIPPQFQDIPSIVSPQFQDSPIHLEHGGGDEPIQNETMGRPQGRKAAKEALRKGKNSSPANPTMVTLMSQNESMASARDKRDELYAKQMQDDARREDTRLQLEMRNDAFRYQEREDRVREKEDEIMKIDPEAFSPIKRKFWRTRQKQIQEKMDSSTSSPASFQPPPFYPGGYPHQQPPPFYPGNYPPQQPFPGGYFPQQPFLGSYSPQQPFPGSYSPQQPFPGSYSPQQPLDADYPPRSRYDGDTTQEPLAGNDWTLDEDD